MPLRLFHTRRDKLSELQSLSDEQLAGRFAAHGDPDCLGVLYERYTHLVFAVSIKYLGNDAEAEDMVMTVFEKLFSELKHTRVDNFRSWLFAVTRNQCLMSLRHEKTAGRAKEECLRRLESEIMETAGSAHPLPGENGDNRLEHLQQGIERLNEAQQRCVQLFYLQELSYREVSDQTGYNLNEVKSHLQNGRRNLKIYLENAERP